MKTWLYFSAAFYFLPSLLSCWVMNSANSQMEKNRMSGHFFFVSLLSGMLIFKVLVPLTAPNPFFFFKLFKFAKGHWLLWLLITALCPVSLSTPNWQISWRKSCLLVHLSCFCFLRSCSLKFQLSLAPLKCPQEMVFLVDFSGSIQSITS